MQQDKQTRSQVDIKKDAVSDYRTRFTLMDAARADWEAEWHYTDQQCEAKIAYDARGRLIVNVPIEDVLLDINDGKYSKQPQRDITGSQDNTDVNQIIPIQFALIDFLDREKFYKENKAAVRDWAKYGTMTMFTGIRETSFMRYEPTEIFDGIYSDDMKQIKRTEYKFCPQNRPIYTTRWDDQAMNQWDPDKAEDLIFEEQITIDTAKERFSDISGFDSNEIRPYAVSDPEYGKFNAYPNQCLIAYKYNKITSSWNIILNKTEAIHVGRYFHNGNLPVRIAQHFTRNNSLHGDGIPKRIRAMKAYKKSILQDILDASKMSAGINLIVPQGTDVIAKVGSGINIWSTTGADSIQPVPIQTRITDMANTLQIIDDLINVDAGENMRAPFSTPKTTLGEIEIMEESKQTRDRAKDMNLSIFYDDVLTDSVVNLTKYAVNMIKTEKEDKLMMIDGEEKTITCEYFPDLSIQVKDKVIERRKGTGNKDMIFFKEDFGSTGTYSLKDCTYDGELRCKVNTPGTKYSTGVQKNSFTQAVTNLVNMVTAFSNMGLDMQAEIKKDFNPSDLIAKWKQVYEMGDSLTAPTKQSETKKEIDDQMKIAQSIMGNEMGTNALSTTPQPNAAIQTPQETSPAAPTKNIKLSGDSTLSV